MPQTLETKSNHLRHPIGMVVVRDKKEVEFENFLRLWIAGKIDYDTLKDKMPDQYKSFWKKFLDFLYTIST